MSRTADMYQTIPIQTLQTYTVYYQVLLYRNSVQEQNCKLKRLFRKKILKRKEKEPKKYFISLPRGYTRYCLYLVTFIRNHRDEWTERAIETINQRSKIKINKIYVTVDFERIEIRLQRVFSVEMFSKIMYIMYI